MKEVCHRAARDRNTEPAILLFEAVKWDRITTLAHDQVSDEAGSVLRLVGGALGRRRVDDVLAAAARQRLAAKNAPPKIAGHVLDHRRWFALTNAAQVCALAVWTGALR